MNCFNRAESLFPNLVVRGAVGVYITDVHGHRGDLPFAGKHPCASASCPCNTTILLITCQLTSRLFLL